MSPIRLALGILGFSTLLVGCSNVRFSESSSDGSGTALRDPAGVDPTGNGDPTGIDPTNPAPTPSPTPVGPHIVDYNITVPPASNKVDFLLVIDNSTSMSADQQKLASQMKGFADKLATLNIDWQMCLTTTTFNSAGQWGHSLPWMGYSSSNRYVLRAADAGTSLNNIFVNTISAIGVDETAGDERGIKSVYNHLLNGAPGVNYANSGGCYRDGAAVAVIVLSDEDERSVGGDASRVKTDAGETVSGANPTYRALTNEDLPQSLLSMAKNLRGQDFRFTFNAIVVDSLACESIQDKAEWYSQSKGMLVTSPSHMGTKYMELSNLTGGGVGSICNSTFQDNLNLFTQKLTNTLKSITLECAPNPLSSLVVKVDNQTKVRGTDYTVSGAALSFAQAIVQGTRIDISYQCQ